MADEDENHPFKNDLQGPQGATNPFMNERVAFTRERIDLRPVAEVSDADMQALRDAQPTYEAAVPYSPLRGNRGMPEDQRSMFDWRSEGRSNGGDQGSFSSEVITLCDPDTGVEREVRVVTID